MSNLIRAIILAIIISGCKEDKAADEYVWHTITVTATAYNSVVGQTNDDPYTTAFGDSLAPGMKYIAVSRDLLKLGLTHNTPVKIDGFDTLYIVKDKMHRRWVNKIDIYMGHDVKKARHWGRKKVRISYPVKKQKPNDTIH